MQHVLNTTSPFPPTAATLRLHGCMFAGGSGFETRLVARMANEWPLRRTTAMANPPASVTCGVAFARRWPVLTTVRLGLTAGVSIRQ